MTCTHTHTKSGEHYGFSAPIADAADQNPAAHGGVTYTETCRDCGAHREVNANGVHHEYGRWEPRSYTVRPRGCANWQTGLRTLEDARRSAREARDRGLARVVIVDDSTGEVVE